jgi:hypothetical protein
MEFPAIPAAPNSSPQYATRQKSKEKLSKPGAHKSTLGPYFRRTIAPIVNRARARRVEWLGVMKSVRGQSKVL